METLIRKAAFLFILLLACSFFVYAQHGDARQKGQYISGTVLDATDLSPLEGAQIFNPHNKQKISTNADGFFKVQVQAGDTLQISHEHYKQSHYLVPATLKGSQYALIQLMDQKQASQVENQRQFPSQDQFEQALLEMERVSLVNRTAELNQNLDQVLHDPTKMQKYLNDHQPYQYLYELPENPTGVPNNFLNPERWANFIKDWREGRFTQQGMEKLDGFPGELKRE